MAFLPLGAQLSCTRVCCASYGSPVYARICVLGLRSSLITGLGSYPPTSALQPSPCPPGHHLHRSRIRPPPTSVSPLLPSGTSASAQHKRDAAAQHNVLQPRALCCNRVPPVPNPAADGACCNRLHAAALPCRWLHPIRSKQAKQRRRRPNRLECPRHCGRGWAST